MGGDHSGSDGGYETLESKLIGIHLLAGASAGVMEHIIVYPLDTVKTRMQSMTQKSYKGIIESLRHMMTKEGILRPIRGLNVVIAGTGPAHALYFSSYEFTKYFVSNNFRVNDNISYGAAGVIATLLHDAIHVPTDVVKQRLQMYDSPYRNVIDCIVRVHKQEGLAAFFRSFSTQLVMNIPFHTSHFIAYEFAQNISNPERHYNVLTHVISGGLAGGVAAAVTTPLDVCKTFLNTQPTGETVSGLRNAIAYVYRLGGLAGFFKGTKARVLYTMPSTAICWSTYETFKHFLHEKSDDSRSLVDSNT
uniref:Mitoferrin n=1 Tax=Cacopsylla melanoneura TaxID=428564 RepID=A0A8D8SIV4_9HEMI